MKNNIKNTFWIPIIIFLLTIIVVIISPEEKEIAAGIKPVYVHVSLTWTAMLLFFVSGLIAITNIIKRSEKIDKWLKHIFGVALAFHLSGLIMSIISSYINWGGVRLGEAKFQTTIYILIFGGIALLLMNLVKISQINSVLALIPAGLLIWASNQGQIGLHPSDPVMNAPASIKYTFLGLFLLMICLASWIIVYFKPKKSEN